ncbi:putative sugar ABC transporter permease protein [Oscillibacter valericigenes Sjm18-20]|nr:putative sugar ABC transporter permease protein [Oscillibacter valericigenes Sjm18-20]
MRSKKNPVKKEKNLKFQKYLVNYLGLLPFFVLFVVFVLYPFFYGIVMSFTDWSVSSRGNVNFVGLENYKYVLSGVGTSSVRFLASLKNLLIYVPLTLLIGLTLSLVLALILSQIKRGYSFFRGAWFAPYVLPLFICAGIWQWFMTTNTGLVASFFAKLGIGVGVDWSSTAIYAIFLVIFIDVWNSVGFNFVMISAGMKDISPELYEAAELDGASTIQKMRYITIPMLEPILFVVITYGFVSALQVYDIPWILSGTGDYNNIGGPGQCMLFPVMEMVRNIYLGANSGLGRATAEGVILMIFIMLITLVQFKVRKKRY